LLRFNYNSVFSNILKNNLKDIRVKKSVNNLISPNPDGRRVNKTVTSNYFIEIDDISKVRPNQTTQMKGKKKSKKSKKPTKNSITDNLVASNDANSQLGNDTAK
jgi:hypothetical protein